MCECMAWGQIYQGHNQYVNTSKFVQYTILQILVLFCYNSSVFIVFICATFINYTSKI